MRARPLSPGPAFPLEPLRKVGPSFPGSRLHGAAHVIRRGGLPFCFHVRAPSRVAWRPATRLAPEVCVSKTRSTPGVSRVDAAASASCWAVPGVPLFTGMWDIWWGSQDRASRGGGGGLSRALGPHPLSPDTGSGAFLPGGLEPCGPSPTPLPSTDPRLLQHSPRDVVRFWREEVVFRSSCHLASTAPLAPAPFLD